MIEYDNVMSMMLTGMERRGKRLVDEPNPADIVLERTAFQIGISASFRNRACDSCGGEFHSVSAEDRVCDWCRRRRIKA